MEETTSREKILKKIRNALISKTENPYPSLDTESSVYPKLNDSIDIAFAQEFTRIAGKFVYCENEVDLSKNLASLVLEKKWKSVYCIDKDIQPVLDKAKINYTDDPETFVELQAGITQCEFLIARLGSVMISSRQISGRRLNVFPETHIVIARSKQIVPELKDAIEGIRKKYNSKLPSLVTVISGPSRTADIEKTLVMGAHGPKELYVFLLDDES
ncbi:MAG: lactate utilization protein [Bacteroidales bacterium]|nr:lactate utilization protein [Bacteroidales bacterium]